MNSKEQSPNELFVQANTCCKGFLQNQIGVLQAIRKVLEEYDKKEVIKQIDQILGYYNNKLTELSMQKTP